MTALTPQEIVSALDRHIIGQNAAKRAVAIALRNRWRRLQLDPALRADALPGNILMVGPTGVGKTEIARRLAALANAPFVKVEANGFADAGQIICMLADGAVKMLREQAKATYRPVAEERAEEHLLDALLPKRRGPGVAIEINSEGDNEARVKLRRQLRAGELEQREVELEISEPGHKRLLSIALARTLLIEEALARFINDDEIRQQAIAACENAGIVLIDAIDTLCRCRHANPGDDTHEPIQRRLLPLLEGTIVNTRHGAIRTDHILFIAAGTFESCSPSDLIAGLQGRFPVRVGLSALSGADFKRILTEPVNAPTRHYQALLATEGVSLEFSDDALERLAELACARNERQENIGARQLHTLLQALLADIAFQAPECGAHALVIDRAMVDAIIPA